VNGLSLILAAGAAAAHDPRCDSTNFYDLLGCANDAYEKADLELNAQWEKMPHDQPLVDAQRAWIVWRDQECVARNAAIGGWEEPIWKYACLADLTEQRTRQLKESYRWLALEEGETAE